MPTSDCLRSFGHGDFDPARLDQFLSTQCPVRGCSAPLVKLPYGKQHDRKGKHKERILPWCPEHGIRLHSGTFVYWNGRGLEDVARLRNFIVERDLATAIALGKGMKAESYRLGYEMSEDALSWNVLVSLALAGKLRAATTFLTDRTLRAEPHLYLWGWRIDTRHREPVYYESLRRVLCNLERDIHTFRTEPDIMLVSEGELLVSIEAKFGSANPLAHGDTDKKQEKPNTRAGLIARYLGGNTSDRTKRIVQTAHFGPKLHSQLFRNIVFASEMAQQTPWHVVNLVSATQRGTAETAHYSFADPEAAVRCYLGSGSQGCFTYRTWEALHAAVIKDDHRLADLDRYLCGKSAHYLPAFKLS